MEEMNICLGKIIEWSGCGGDGYKIYDKEEKIKYSVESNKCHCTAQLVIISK